MYNCIVIILTENFFLVSLTSYLVLFSMLGLCLIFVLGALVVFCMINKRQRIKSSLKQQHHQHIDVSLLKH